MTRLSKREADILHAAAGMDMFWPLRCIHVADQTTSGEVRYSVEALLVNYQETRRLRDLDLVTYCGTSHIKITPEGVRVLNEFIGSQK